ncbi:hypothetical protein HA466_0314750 [Hirschfeldia incana]|nr:hypothetical protein HA466_0314750 [Hirschfeldia incana]
MGEELSDTMNLDLNLGPGPESSDLQLALNETVNYWTNNEPPPSERSSSDAVTRIRTRHRTRFTQLNLPIIPVLSETMTIDLSQLIGSSATLQTGEGSERGNEDLKMCENGEGAIGDGVPEEKADVEKSSSGNDGNFFDCNICLDVSKEPVLTCCGHLYCWPCLFQWLNISEAKECPVCKGEVTSKTVTPIYGRGNPKRKLVEECLDPKIPMRPHARRIESLRSAIQRSPFTIPMEEMIRRIQSRFDRDSNLVPDAASERVNDRANLILNRLMTSRGVRTEQSQASAAPEDVDLNPSVAPDHLEGETTSTRFHPLLIRRQLQSHRVARISNITSALSSAERLVDAYFRTHPLGRNQHQELNHHHAPVVVDDRDSFSSIAAVMNSESQVDTAVEIDSMVTLSTSSSRRRNENGSRVSDVDSADSPPPRRRRFT